MAKLSRREAAIQSIERLFPADSKFVELRMTGIRLLEEAKRNANNWRNESDAILFEYEKLCIEESQQREDVS